MKPKTPRLAAPGDPLSPDFVRRPEEIEFTEEDERVSDAALEEVRERRKAVKEQPGEINESPGPWRPTPEQRTRLRELAERPDSAVYVRDDTKMMRLTKAARKEKSKRNPQTDSKTDSQ